MTTAFDFTILISNCIDRTKVRDLLRSEVLPILSEPSLNCQAHVTTHWQVNAMINYEKLRIGRFTFY